MNRIITSLIIGFLMLAISVGAIWLIVAKEIADNPCKYEDCGL